MRNSFRAETKTFFFWANFFGAKKQYLIYFHLRSHIWYCCSENIPPPGNHPIHDIFSVTHDTSSPTKNKGESSGGEKEEGGKRVYPDFLLWAIPPSHTHEKEERGCWKWWHPYHTSSYSKVHLPTHACILRIIYPTSHGRRGLHHKREGLGKFFVFLKATTSLRRFQKKPCTTEKRPVPMFVVSKLVIKSTDLPSYPALFFSHRKKNMWQKSGVFAGRK